MLAWLGPVIPNPTANYLSIVVTMLIYQGGQLLKCCKYFATIWACKSKKTAGRDVTVFGGFYNHSREGTDSNVLFKLLTERVKKRGWGKGILAPPVLKNQLYFLKQQRTLLHSVPGFDSSNYTV